MLSPEVITWMVCGLSFKAFLLQTLEILLLSTECGLMLETSISLENIFSHQKLQDCLISVACSGFITSARGRSFSQRPIMRERERALTCSAEGSQQAWEMLTQREGASVFQPLTQLADGRVQRPAALVLCVPLKGVMSWGLFLNGISSTPLPLCP